MAYDVDASALDGNCFMFEVIAVSPSSAHAILALLAANVEVETPLNGARTLPACRQFARLRFGGRFLSANG
jgi:hypothetical protein